MNFFSFLDKNFFIFLGIYFAIFVFAEILKLTVLKHADDSRKIAHILAGTACLFFPYYLNVWQIFYLAIVFVFGLLATKMIGWSLSIHGVERKTWGEILFPIGVCIIVFLMLPRKIEAFQFGVAVLTFSDAAASLIGVHFGKKPIFLNSRIPKTIQGCTAFFVTTLIISAFFATGANFFFIKAIIAAAVLTVVEFYSVFGLDSITLPLVAAFLYTGFLM